MNNFSFIGRLGRDAEVRYTQTQKPVTDFAVAITSGWGENEKTTWVKCVLWGDRGPKLAEYIRKGDRIGIEGEVSLSTWINKEQVEKTTLEVNVRNITLLGDKRDAAPAAPPAPTRQQAAPPTAPDFDDDIPFSNYELKTWA